MSSTENTSEISVHSEVMHSVFSEKPFLKYKPTSDSISRNIELMPYEIKPQRWLFMINNSFIYDRDSDGCSDIKIP